MLAILFPGQGSQEVGMGRDVFETSRAGRRVFERADDALGFKLSRLCFEGPEDELRLTENQQPAILTTSLALLRALEETGPVTADFMAGHSLGEYSALAAAGALGLEDAVRLVHVRGRYMQEAVAQGRGAMAAIMGCSTELVIQACEEAARQTGGIVTPANFNSPLQTVIAGDVVAVELAGTRARELGAKLTVPLAVSAPFHCELMAPAARKFALELSQARFLDASPPVVTNVEAVPNASARRMPELLETQITAPVRFTEIVEKLRSLGVTHYLEVGPGRVLSGLVGRIQRRARRAGLSTLSELTDARSFLAEAGA